MQLPILKFMKLTISPEALQLMYDHAESTFPNECCGFFYGQDNEVRQVEVAVEVTNSKDGDQRRRFSISPTDYMKAEKHALENKTTLLGVYHSHPNHPAIPSEHDLKQAFPFFSYIIVSVNDGKIADLRSWQLNEEGSFVEEEVENGMS